MNLILRSRLIIGAAMVVAIWIGFQVGDSSYALAAVIATIGLGVALTRLAGVSIEVLALGAALFGYFVGNRGFAQLMPVPNVPLLPAELAMLVAGFALAVRCALARTLPFRSDALNWTILLWMVVGTVRVVFDVRPYGVMAIRDYATVYYAAFFFLAQQIAVDPKSRRFLLGVLLVAAAIQPIAAIVSETFPGFFFSDLSIRGVPIILFKGDLLYTFIGVSALLIAFSAPEKHRPAVWGLATLELLFVISGANRASMLGVLVALGWIAFTARRRFVLLQGVAITAALAVVITVAALFHVRAAEEKLLGVTDRVRSVTDVFGTGRYESSESAMKGDNNRFRTLWWHITIDSTLANNAVFGLGFGYDLAHDFLEIYNPEIEDFTARSPHSIVVTVFARMGFVGLGSFLLLVAALGFKTWRTMRDPTAAGPAQALWASAWLILVSACFGVVLEGPMTAVVFWSVLGIANAMAGETRSSELEIGILPDSQNLETTRQ